MHAEVSAQLVEVGSPIPCLLRTKAIRLGGLMVPTVTQLSHWPLESFQLSFPSWLFSVRSFYISSRIPVLNVLHIHHIKSH